MALQEKNVLVIMPKNQFCGDELFGVLKVLENHGVRAVVLSKSGKEAVGMNRERYTPDGLIVDWNKQEGVFGKYHAVILIGGKGAQKSLWDDTIVPQILVDHHRAGKIIGALGAASVVLARASLLTDEIAAPEYEPARTELQVLGVDCGNEPVMWSDQIVTGSGGKATEPFSEKIVELLKEVSH